MAGLVLVAMVFLSEKIRHSSSGSGGVVFCNLLY